MIGNDIVDLKLAAKDSNWKRPRFLDKVFTTEEQQFILDSNNQNQAVWMLWSMKEAAYKVHVRQFGKRFFNPKRLTCHLTSNHEGFVIIDDNIYYTKSNVNKDYIHTVASTTSTRKVIARSSKTENFSFELQSEWTRDIATEAYSKSRNIVNTSIIIQKDKLGVPYFFKNNKKSKEMLSMSHHGNYCAYAIL